MTTVFLHHTSGDEPHVIARVLALPSANEISDGPFGRSDVFSADTDTDAFADVYGKIRIYLTDDQETAAAILAASPYRDQCQIEKIGDTTVLVETGAPTDGDNLIEITELRDKVTEDLDFSFRMSRDELGLATSEMSI